MCTENRKGRMVERLDLALLGHPEPRLAGQPLVRLRSAKAYALLYYLVVTRRAQPRTVLAGLFWGDVDEYYARRNLNRTLSDLNQAVGDHLVVARQRLAFARHQPYWLDVELHPATMARDHCYNEPLLAELRSELPSTVFAQAAAWVASQGLESVVRWLLHGQGSVAATL